jgi:hypothetical protein
MMSAVEGGELGRLDQEFDALMAEPSTRLEAFLVRYVQSAPLTSSGTFDEPRREQSLQNEPR